jgi:hypothetical protein
VCVCARARVRVRACACACVCDLWPLCQAWGLKQSSRAWLLWGHLVEDQRQQELHVLCTHAAARIQRSFRSFAARRRIYLVRAEMRHAMEQAAAVKMQTLYRSRAARARRRDMARLVAMNMAAAKIQRAVR